MEIIQTKTKGVVMKKIDININHAKLLSFSAMVGDETVDVSATLGLFSGEKKISDFTITTQEYYSGVKFDLPIGMIEPIMTMAKQLEIIVIRECNSAMAELPAPKEEIK